MRLMARRGVPARRIVPQAVIGHTNFALHPARAGKCDFVGESTFPWADLSKISLDGQGLLGASSGQSGRISSILRRAPALGRALRKPEI